VGAGGLVQGMERGGSGCGEVGVGRQEGSRDLSVTAGSKGLRAKGWGAGGAAHRRWLAEC